MWSKLTLISKDSGVTTVELWGRRGKGCWNFLGENFAKFRGLGVVKWVFWRTYLTISKLHGSFNSNWTLVIRICYETMKFLEICLILEGFLAIWLVNDNYVCSSEGSIQIERIINAEFYHFFVFKNQYKGRCFQIPPFTPFCRGRK